MSMNVFALGPCALAGLAVASASDDPRSEGVQAFFLLFSCGWPLQLSKHPRDPKIHMYEWLILVDPIIIDMVDFSVQKCESFFQFSMCPLFTVDHARLIAAVWEANSSGVLHLKESQRWARQYPRLIDVYTLGQSLMGSNFSFSLLVSTGIIYVHQLRIYVFARYLRLAMYTGVLACSEP